MYRPYTCCAAKHDHLHPIEADQNLLAVISSTSFMKTGRLPLHQYRRFDQDSTSRPQSKLSTDERVLFTSFQIGLPAKLSKTRRPLQHSAHNSEIVIRRSIHKLYQYSSTIPRIIYYESSIPFSCDKRPARDERTISKNARYLVGTIR